MYHIRAVGGLLCVLLIGSAVDAQQVVKPDRANDTRALFEQGYDNGFKTVTHFDDLRGTIFSMPLQVEGQTVQRSLFVLDVAYGDVDGFLVTSRIAGVLDDGTAVFAEREVDEELDSFADFVGRKTLVSIEGVPQELLVEEIRVSTLLDGTLVLDELSGLLRDGASFSFSSPSPDRSGGCTAILVPSIRCVSRTCANCVENWFTDCRCAAGAGDCHWTTTWTLGCINWRCFLGDCVPVAGFDCQCV